MTGWKTWIAAALSICYGVFGWLLDLHGPDAMMSFVINGLALVGIGHKIEKTGPDPHRIGQPAPTHRHKNNPNIS